MLKKTLTYKNFNGEEVTEDFYFNMTESEISKMQLEVPGGMAAQFQAIIDSKNAPELMKTFEDIILRAYGVKSADGKRFTKSQELRDEFKNSAAYDQLFMTLIRDPKAAAEFAKAILPETLNTKELEKAIPASAK